VLEILVLWKLGSSLAEKCRAKGHQPVGYVALMVLLWFVGMVLGFIVGAVLNASAGDEPPVLLLVVFAYGGAAIGAVIAFTIVGSLPDLRARFDPIDEPRHDGRAPYAGEAWSTDRYRTSRRDPDDRGYPDERVTR
jgi:hypothetical protein